MKNEAFYRLAGAALAAFLMASTSADARQDEHEARLATAPLFTSHAPLAVTIEAPLTTLMADRPEEEYLDGTFSFTGDDGTEHALDLKIRVRGNFRLQEEICEFAPIRLNFRKKQVTETEFARQDKLKLVTHCQNNNSYFGQLVLREYLAYRFFQLMTDKSFSVRLLEIDYVDTEGGEPMNRIGFVIENDDDVAERLDMETVKSDNITHDDLDPQQENLVNVFHYMIGNTDFSLINGEPDKSCCHNTELMSSTMGAPYTPVPFDFDFAGMVNAPYAGTNPKFNLRNVRQRLYRGQCKNNELLPDTLQQFSDKKDTIYEIIDELALLRSRSRRDVTAYLDAFYDQISKPKNVNRRFIEHCIGPS